ncbi:hypothetical protein F442_22479 [Phytophthora nicotianae P10297]|uniref:Uncharacterized protein n=1 Tax=Phytophthora nicotianae P10297 TaxID=1317064 RepID=W2XZW9_PHYNI|nr:hypothetical protein F442_22479 [Phytophthora nicotianae P10297]
MDAWCPTFFQALGTASRFVFFPPKHNRTGTFKWGNKKNSFNRMVDCTFAEVLIQYPGDVVYLNNLVQHSVLQGYQPETADIDKWGGVGGAFLEKL